MNELIYDFILTPDGGYIFVGATESNDGDVNDNNGARDLWVVKTDDLGTIEWEQCYGGSYSEGGSSIVETNDGNYIIAGGTSSNDGDVFGNHGPGNYDVWIVKLDIFGNILWQKCFGGTGMESCAGLNMTSDGGLILGCYANSNDGDVVGNHILDDNIWGEGDFWILKLDSVGDIQWQKCLGGFDNEQISDIFETNDGGFLALGATLSSDGGDVIGTHGSADGWVVKLNANGVLQWQKCLGGSDSDVLHCGFELASSNFILSGTTASTDGDVSSNNGGFDLWILEINEFGNLVWESCYGGTGNDYAFSMLKEAENAYVAAGMTSSIDGDVSEINGGYDYWLIKVNSLGALEWQKCFGGSGDERANSIISNIDNGYVLGGHCESADGDVSNNQGGRDFWVVSVSEGSPAIVSDNSTEQSIYPNPSDGLVHIRTNQINGGIHYFVLDSMGRKIMSHVSKSAISTIDLNQLPAGVYSIYTREGFQGRIVKCE